MTEQTSASSVQHLGFAWFAMVMGLCGLSLAWARAVPHWGSVALQVSLGVGVFAAGVLSLLLLGQLWRLLRYPVALMADATHPIRHVFVAALPSSLVLLPTVWVVHQGYSLWADVLWMLGAAGLLLATLGVVGRWLQPGLTAQDFWPGITPALFIPVVGNVLPALAGVSLGHPVWAAAQFGLAAVLWPVALALVWVRIGMVGLWPQRLLPTTFIMVAPPSVLALSGHALGVPSMAVHMLAGVALFFSLLSFTVIRRCLQQPFGMPFWALSFPLAASAALGLHLSPEPGLAQWLASLWLGVVTGVIGALLLATLRGLMQGQLLQPERPATLPKAGAEPSQPAGR